MNEPRGIRATKGLLLFLAFLGVAVSILAQPDRGAVGYLNRVGVRAEVLALWFLVSSVVCGYTGLTYRHWNAMWFAPVFIYTGMTWLALFFSTTNPPMVSGFMYTLLSCLLVIDLFKDMGVSRRAGATH